MNPHPTPTTPNPGQQAEDAAFYRDILHGLVTMGNDIAKDIHARITTHPTPEQPQQPQRPEQPEQPQQPQQPEQPEQPGTQALTVAFDRIARCIRRTILLARKVAEPPPANPGAPAREAARKRILREVEDAIHREAAPAAAPALQAELLDRLDAPDIEDDVATRPIEDVIADICRDLGVPVNRRAFKFKRRTPQDIETLCARAANPPALPPPALPTPATQPGNPTHPPDPPGRAPPHLTVLTRLPKPPP